jgi:2-polyprenyl-3-methyl-5-hydroxy-6-metoxy-1,4-benzoquinol methylase
MGNRRLLEIGCGVGEYLGTMQSLGWDVVGLEPSPYAIESAEPSLQPKIIHEKFPTDLPMGGPFSLVVAWQVLEHLADPRQCLLAVRELLATDGLLMLAVPNADSWSARLFGGDWIGWDVPRHLVHFTKKTLKALLHRTGFDILHMGSEPRSSWVRHSTRQCSGWKRRLLKSSAGSRLFAYSSWIVGQADSLFVMARPR